MSTCCTIIFSAGLLGNVAEVSFLRPQLMTEEFISVFYGLLDSTQDNIEVKIPKLSICRSLDPFVDEILSL